MNRRVLLVVATWLLARPAVGQLLVSEIMYDPASADERWEWLEVWNTGEAAVDLDGWIIDRLADRERTVVTPNISSLPFAAGGLVENPTVIPAGGVAVLYNGEGLGYDPQRFLAAWPSMPRHTPLIGVSGWAGNQLSNRPEVSEYAPFNHALTLGVWSNEDAYRLDVTDFGTAAQPDRRVHKLQNTEFFVGYDDSAPWRGVEGRASLQYLGGPHHRPNGWGVSRAHFGVARSSVPTFLPVPINEADFGSPGIGPVGQPASAALQITEVMYNPASATAGSEWEWIEVYNPGASIDLAATPHWFDDDDGSALAAPNLTVGTIPAEQTVVLYNANATSLEHMRAAWDRPGRAPIALIGVEEWPTLANSGDRIALWDSATDYASDRAGEVPTTQAAVAALEYGSAAGWPTAANGESVYLANLGSPSGDPSGWATAGGLFGDPNAYEAAEVYEPGGVVDSSGGDHGSPGRVSPDVVTPYPGDYNRDGRVDAADYTLWRDGSPLPTEFVTAGVTDQADLQVWRSNYGLSPSAPAHSVPEPSAVSLMAAAAALTCRRRLVARQLVPADLAVER